MGLSGSADRRNHGSAESAGSCAVLNRRSSRTREVLGRRNHFDATKFGRTSAGAAISGVVRPRCGVASDDPPLDSLNLTPSFDAPDSIRLRHVVSYSEAQDTEPVERRCGEVLFQDDSHYRVRERYATSGARARDILNRGGYRGVIAWHSDSSGLVVHSVTHEDEAALPDFIKTPIAPHGSAIARAFWRDLTDPIETSGELDALVASGLGDIVARDEVLGFGAIVVEVPAAEPPVVRSYRTWISTVYGIRLKVQQSHLNGAVREWMATEVQVGLETPADAFTQEVPMGV